MTIWGCGYYEWLQYLFIDLVSKCGIKTYYFSAIATASLLLASLFSYENSSIGRSKLCKVLKFIFFICSSALLSISGLLVILRCSNDYCDGAILLCIAGMTLIIASMFCIFQVYLIRPCSNFSNFEVEDEYSKNKPDYHPAKDSRNSTMVIWIFELKCMTHAAWDPIYAAIFWNEMYHQIYELCQRFPRKRKK